MRDIWLNLKSIRGARISSIGIACVWQFDVHSLQRQHSDSQAGSMHVSYYKLQRTEPLGFISYSITSIQ